MLYSISLPDVGETDIRLSAIIDEALTFNLPEDVEKSLYSQCRSKGLAIIASAQRLPDEHKNERAGWSWQSNNIFAMRVSDLNTRQKLAQRIGQVRYDEKQKNLSTGDRTSSTESYVQRQHHAIDPENFGTLKNRTFVMFHENGVAPGWVKNVPGTQRNIEPIIYDKRGDVIDFLSDL